MSEKKVLVIDDEDFIRELVKDFLEMEGIPCDSAENPEDGVKLVSQNTYHLILLDRNIGKYQAEDIIVLLREINTEVPIVLLTGDADCDDAYMEKIGAVGIIYKPFQVMDFITKIREFLETE